MSSYPPDWAHCAVWGLRLGSGPSKPDIYELGTEFQKSPPPPVVVPPYYPLLDRGLEAF